MLLAAFTGTLWFATTTQARLAKEALIANKRAFLFAVDLRYEYEIDATTNLYNWRFRPVWMNSGDTPTKGMTLYCGCELRNTPLELGYNFNKNVVSYPGIIGAKSSNTGGVAPMPPSTPITPNDIIDIQAGKNFSIYGGGFVIWTYSLVPRNILPDSVGLLRP
ncbi:MAG: hypothetical protein EXQ98_05550 [Alphaproteobacteria bacterium]|nr:hypothetical protein [Alphaproteobacteria bacterium]